MVIFGKFVIFAYKIGQTARKTITRLKMRWLHACNHCWIPNGWSRRKIENFTPTGSCPVRDVLCRLGDKWSMLVLLTLNANGVMRFSEIHRTLGDISHRMLTVTLRMLETDGMIRREVYAEVPPRVEYRLTERGGSLLPHIFGLVEWAEANKEAILDGRRRS